MIAASVAAPALCVWLVLLRHDRRGGRLVPALLVTGVACRLAFALGTPAFYAPDEQPHFKYVEYLYQHRALPVQVSRTNAASNDWEYYQPPLYYLLCLPLYALSAGVVGAPAAVTVVLLRCVSLACWAATLALALRLLRRLALDGTGLRVVVFAVLACLPSYAFSSASINNDNLLVAVGAQFLYVLAGPPSPRRAALLGLLLACALLTKLTAVVYLFALGALLLVYLVHKKLTPARAATLGGLSVCIAAALWSPWLLRNLRLYGDLTGERAANVRFGWHSAWHAARTIATYMSESFWAVSGIYNDVEFLPQLGIAFGTLAVAGLAYGAVSPRRRGAWALTEDCKQFLSAMLATIVVNIVLVVRFGYLYNQGQGRFLFPLLIPIAVLIGLGMSAFTRRSSVPGSIAAFFSTYLLSFTAYSLAVF